MITVTHHELHNNTAHVQAQAEKVPVLIAGNEKKQILLNYDDYLLLLNKPTNDTHSTAKPAENEEPSHFLKIAHHLGYEKLADTGIEFGDSLDAALDALNAEIAAMKKETAKPKNEDFVSLYDYLADIPADLTDAVTDIEFDEQ